MKKKTAILVTALTAAFALLTAGAWFFTRNAGEITENKAGVSWYSTDQKEFTITTPEELYDMVKLSAYYDFAGQTVKLGNDIVLNDLTVEEMQKALPERLWETPIYQFAGTFDGQGHSIRGIYATAYLLAPLNQFYEDHPTVEYWSGKYMYTPIGLFAYTKQDAVIKNLNVTDSIFINCANNGCGSIVGNGAGTLDHCYSNATILSYWQHAGGLVGRVENGYFTLNGCWFDGELKLLGLRGNSGGGLVGTVKKAAKATTITHCLNTADIVSENTQAEQPQVGGFVGSLEADAMLVIEDSLSMAEIDAERRETVATAVGKLAETSFLTAKAAYTNRDGYPAVLGSYGSSVISYPISLKEECFQGESALAWTDLDFENHWTVTDGAPALRAFAETVSDRTAAEKAYDVSWFDSNKSEYTLTTLDQLYGLYVLSAENDFSGKTLRLGNDITVNEGNAADWTEEAAPVPWYPICQFAGTFDGDGHAISGVCLYSDEPGTGLFASLASSGVIRNFKLVNSCFVNQSVHYAYMGSIVGCAAGSIDTVYSDAIIVSSAARRTGGIAGTASGSETVTISDCWFDGSITMVGSQASQAGGLIGGHNSGTSIRIEHCLNSGKLEGGVLTGGIVGVIGGTVEIVDTLNTGLLPAEKHVGAVSGWVGSGSTLSFENAYAANDSCINMLDNIQEMFTGGCLGLDRDYLTGIRAYQWTTLDFDEHWAAVDGGTPVLKAFSDNALSTDGVAKKMNTDWYNVREKEYELKNAEDLYGFAYLSYNTDFKRKTVTLANDIDVNPGNAAEWGENAPEDPWIPIYNFAGTFDGKGYTISGIYGNYRTDDPTGLFAKTMKDSVLRDFTLDNSYFTKDGPFLGSIAGQFTGTAEKIYSAAFVTATGEERSRIGGLFGSVADGGAEITECWYDGVLNANNNRYVGGLVGSMDNTSKEVVIRHSMTSGSVSGRDQVAGILGYMINGNVVFEDVLSIGEITSEGATVGTLLGGRYSAKPTVTVRNSAGVGNPDLAGTAAAEEVADSAKINSRTAEDLKGAESLFLARWIDFDTYYVVRDDDVPALRSLIGSVPNMQQLIDRFKDNYTVDQNGKKIYEIKTADDLNGFALVSKSTDFKDCMVNLVANITLNAGSAASWGTTPPGNRFAMIGATLLPFAGTFNGNGHTVSGIYVDTGAETSGFFVQTAETAVIRDLRITNSYFKTTAPYQGSVAGKFAGRAERIYSNATVHKTTNDNSRYGGLFGAISGGSAVLNECWFDGTVNAVGNRYVGGLIGALDADAGAVTISHCLFTGTATSVDHLGGILGYLVSGNVILTDTLSIGTLTTPGTTCGTLVGGRYSATPSITIRDSAGVGTKDLAGTAQAKETTNSAKINSRTREDLKGANGLFLNTWLDFDAHYVLRDNDVPALRSLAGTSKLQASIDNFRNHYTVDANGKKVYTIGNASELTAFALTAKMTDFANSVVKLTADVTLNTGDASTWSAAAPAVEWNSIGSNSLPFAGTFDGQGHTINGLYQKLKTDDPTGFFAATSGTAELKNFRIENSYFEKNGPYLGSVSGTFAGRAEKIYSNAILNATGSRSRIAGLFGAINGSAILSECWFDGVVNAESNQFVGGLIGSLDNEAKLVMVEHSLMSGTVSAKDQVGGLLGYMVSGDVIFEDSLFIGSVVSSGATNGMLVGGRYSAQPTIRIRNSAGVGTKDLAGTAAATEVTNSAKINSRTRDDLTGEAGLFLNTWLDFDTFWVVRDDDTPVLRTLEGTLSDLQQAMDNFKNSCTTDESGKKVYLIRNEDEFDVFALFSKSSDFADAIVKLEADLTLNDGNAADWATTAPEKNWRMIGSTGTPFAGTFDGQGHTISGVYRSTTEQYSGLFCKTAVTAVLKDFRLENSYFTSNVPYEGSIAGSFAGTAERIYSNATVAATGSRSRYAGFFGNVEGSTAKLSECWFDGVVAASGNAYVGGLIGGLDTATDVTISHCLFSGSITGSTEVGGIVGNATVSNSNVTFEDTLSIGSITASKWGGLIGGRQTASSVLTANNSASLGANKWYGNSGAYVSNNATNISSRTAEQLKGEDGLWLGTWLDFEEYWTTRENEVPALKALIP